MNDSIHNLVIQQAKFKNLLPDNNTGEFQGNFLHFHCTSWLWFSNHVHGCNLLTITPFHKFTSHIFTTYDDISQTYSKHMINIHITYEKHIFLCSLIMFIICTHMFIICTRFLQTIICRSP